SSNLAHFDGIGVGDRIELGSGTAASDSFLPTVFNRRETGAGPVVGQADPLANAPVWVVSAGQTDVGGAWNKIQLQPDVATAQAAVATATTAVFTSQPNANAVPPPGTGPTFPNPAGAVSMFQ